MASWSSSDFCPDLKELEKKIGRKTPESLVISIRNHAIGCDEGLISDCDEKGDHNDIDNDNDNFSLKIKHLKEEMRRLRRDDVQILWQLVAVHEGLEALRWLEEERGGALASGGSSLMGSQSSLGTSEPACWPSLTPSSPVRRGCPTEGSPTREDPAGVLRSPDRDAHQGQSLPKPSLRSEGEGSSLGPLGPERGVRDLSRSSGRNDRIQPTSTGPDPEKPRSQEPGVCVNHPQAKRLKGGGSGGLGPTSPKEETNAKQGGAAKGPIQGSGGWQRAEDKLEKALFGYDAQWCWVESQDDVTFL